MFPETVFECWFLLSGDNFTDSFDADYNIGIEKVYSDVDLYKTAKLLSKLVTDGPQMLQSLPDIRLQ